MEDQRRFMQFNKALRIYNSCRPFCLKEKQGNVEQRVECFQQCSRRHIELQDKLKFTLQYNIE